MAKSSKCYFAEPSLLTRYYAVFPILDAIEQNFHQSWIQGISFNSLGIEATAEPWLQIVCGIERLYGEKINIKVINIF